MIRVILGLFVLILCGLPLRASEIFTVSAAGTITTDFINPINTVVSVYRSVQTAPDGTILRTVFSGSVRLFGFDNANLISVALPASSVRLENGWAIVTAPVWIDTLPYEMEVHLYPRSGANLGLMKIRVVNRYGSRTSSVFSYPLGDFNPYPFLQGGVAIFYRQF